MDTCYCVTKVTMTEGSKADTMCQLQMLQVLHQQQLLPHPYEAVAAHCGLTYVKQMAHLKSNAVRRPTAVVDSYSKK